tara:strand:+ start:346 stop:756 length:411 start_codon:yes stop_codon:yes gene_type:complete
MIALLASAVGNWIVKSPVDELLSAPKSKIRTALFADPAVVEELYIIAPLAVIVELENVRSAKSVKAVVLDVEGVTFVKAESPELYPVPDASLLVVNAVVAAPKLALLVYKANLNVLPDPVEVVVPPPLPLVKLCIP